MCGICGTLDVPGRDYAGVETRLGQHVAGVPVRGIRLHEVLDPALRYDDLSLAGDACS